MEYLSTFLLTISFIFITYFLVSRFSKLEKDSNNLNRKMDLIIEILAAYGIKNNKLPKDALKEIKYGDNDKALLIIMENLTNNNERVDENNLMKK